MLGGSTIGAAGALQNINNSSSTSYSNERSQGSGLEVEFASDPASGGFFHADYKKWVVNNLFSSNLLIKLNDK